MKRNILLTIISLIVGCLASFAAEIDVIELTTGTILKGEITLREPDGSLRMTLLNGTRRYVIANEILSVSHIDDPTITEKKEKITRKVPIITKGYKGFVEIGYGYDFDRHSQRRLDISTTHGCQLNQWLFVGGGLGYSLAKTIRRDYAPKRFRSRNTFIFYGDVRATYPFKNSVFEPFFEQKVGYAVVDLNGFYASSSIGVRLALHKRQGLSLGVGAIYQGHRGRCTESIVEYWGDRPYLQDWRCYWFYPDFLPFFVKIGYDF